MKSDTANDRMFNEHSFGHEYMTSIAVDKNHLSRLAMNVCVTLFEGVFCFFWVNT